MELKIKCVNTTTSSDGSQYGKFVIEPLEKGFGTTIGNSLRRVLLSSLEGTAVTSARIEGITHEYTAIPGVLEDVIDVMLNLKGLAIKTDSKESYVNYTKMTIGLLVAIPSVMFFAVWLMGSVGAMLENIEEISKQVTMIIVFITFIVLSIYLLLKNSKRNEVTNMSKSIKEATQYLFNCDFFDDAFDPEGNAEKRRRSFLCGSSADIIYYL